MPVPSAGLNEESDPPQEVRTVPQSPEELVELLPDAEPFLSREAAVSAPEERSGLVLVTTLAGDFDAGHGGALAAGHLLGAPRSPGGPPLSPRAPPASPAPPPPVIFSR